MVVFNNLQLEIGFWSQNYIYQFMASINLSNISLHSYKFRVYCAIMKMHILPPYVSWQIGKKRGIVVHHVLQKTVISRYIST